MDSQLVLNEDSKPISKNSSFSNSDHDSRRGSQSSQRSQTPKLSLAIEEEPFVRVFHSVEVDFPVETQAILFTHMVFKIKVTWGEEMRTVSRRYKNVHKLRKVIRSKLPFTILFPAHYKDFVDQRDAQFLSCRTQELTYFFKYLIHYQEKFASVMPILDTFFNPAFDEAAIDKRMKEYKEQLNYAQLIPIYRRLTQNDDYVVPRLEKRRSLDKFNISLTTTLKFFRVS